MAMKALLSFLVAALVIASADLFGFPPAPSPPAITGASSTETHFVSQDPDPPINPARRPAILDLAEPHFDHLTNSDGLSQSTVTCILQDRQGYMWFGTLSGLNKYDGYTFTVYRNDPDDPGSLRDDYITALYEDENGVIWAGTSNGWLERYNRTLDNFSHHNINTWALNINKIGEGPLVIYSDSAARTFNIESLEVFVSLVDWTSNIFTDSSGNEWWVYNGWLYTGQSDYRPSWVRLTELFMSEDYSFNKIVEDSGGDIWIGIDGGGLSRYQPETGELTHYQHDPTDPDSLIVDGVTSLVEAEPGYLWVGTSSGLDYLNTQTGKFRHIRKIPGDPHSLSDNAIDSLYKDRAGILWIGTDSAGINKLDQLGAHFLHLHPQSYDPQATNDTWVQGIAMDRGGDLWIGTSHGLVRYDHSLPGWRHYDLDPIDADNIFYNMIYTIYEDRAGNLWVGSVTALDRYDRQVDAFVHAAYEGILAMTEDSSGVFWVASGDTLYKFNPELHALSNQRLASANWFTKILADSRGTLWIGTYGGGLYYSDGASFRLYSVKADDPGSLSSNDITALFEDSSGVLWVGTIAGLNRFDRQTGTFTRFSVKDGLPNDSIFGILEDSQGKLWLSTMGGISRLDPQTGAFRNYDVSDGLQGNDFEMRSYFKGESGELYFGGAQGLNVFLPEEIQENTHIPPVVITKVSLFDQVIGENLRGDEEILLPYTQNAISFEYAALDFASPEKNLYAYRMEGLDRDWVAAGTRRFAEYRNMPPGNYTFRVKGSNNDGVWNEAGAAVKITITPPFWQTGWFIGLIVLAAVGAAYGAYRLRVRSLESRSRELEVQVAARTQELAEEIAERERAEEELSQKKAEAAVVAERNRLARDLHDSVTQSLYGVTLYSDAVDRQLEAGDLQEVKSNLSKLHATAVDALGEMRLLVFELHPPTLEEAGLASAIQERLDVVERRSGKQVNFSVEGACALPLLKQEGLYRIAQEALNNALKHARAQSIAVRLRSDAETCTLEIQDDGAGFDPDNPQTHSGLGLRSMQQRAEQIGGIFYIESQPGRGTRVRVQVPTG